MWRNLRNPYPRSTENRIRLRERGFKRFASFYLAAARSFLLLQLLFLGLFCYTLGSLFLQTSNTSNIRFVFVDYDRNATTGANSDIGRAVLAAYTSLQGPSYPTMLERSVADYPTADELRTAVCATDYWAALYVSPGASARLRSALSGDTPAIAYDPSTAMTYIWNQVRYSVTSDTLITFNLGNLAQAARVAYVGSNATASVAGTDPAVLSVLATPWNLQSINIMPTTQGSRQIYNSQIIFLLITQEFFYLGMMNGLYETFKIYHRVHPSRTIVIRTINSALYCLIGSLCTTAAIWAFKGDWAVDAGQFALSWMAFWLFAHANFLTLDVLTVWIPAPYVPMGLITWTVTNLTSLYLPFELSPDFYRIGYALPAHEVYQILLHIWSRGCNPTLSYSLPILFAWEVVGLAGSCLGMYRRAHSATIDEEKQQAQFTHIIDAAVAAEREKERHLQLTTTATTGAAARGSRSPSESRPSSSGPESSTEPGEALAQTATAKTSGRDESSNITRTHSTRSRRMSQMQSMASPRHFGLAFPPTLMTREASNAIEDDDSEKEDG